jgi:hypothetical protein
MATPQHRQGPYLFMRRPKFNRAEFIWDDT